MFWKKNNSSDNPFKLFDDYFGISELKQQVKQLECEHDFKFKKYSEQHTYGRFGKIIYECSECGKTKRKYWKYLTKKEQQAFKTLNLVPEYWEMKKK